MFSGFEVDVSQKKFALLVVPIRATCPTHRGLRDFTTLTIIGDPYNQEVSHYVKS